jgi:MFS family permease
MSRIDKPQRKTGGISKLLAPITGNKVLQNRTLLAVSLVVCASYTGIGMIVPVRVLYAQSRGASLAIISAMASAYLISNFAAQYPSGWMADRWGRKRVMFGGLIAQAALTGAYLFINDPILFVVLRFVEGIAGATTLPPARALIADTVSPENRGEAYGLFNAFFNFGFLLGPAIGGLIASTGYASAFIGAVFFRVAAIFLVLFLIKEERQGGQAEKERGGEQSDSITRKQARGELLRALFTLPLVGAYILVFGDFLYLGFDITLMPLWLHYHLGASVGVIGLVYVMWAIPSIIMSPIGGRIADRRRRSVLIFIFGLAQVPLYTIYGLVNVAWPIVVLFAVHGIVYSLIQPAVDATVATSSPPDVRARVQSMYSSFGLVAAFVGASGFSILYGINFRLPLFAMATAVGVCTLIGGSMIRIAEQRGMVSGPRKSDQGPALQSSQVPTAEAVTTAISGDQGHV